MAVTWCETDSHGNDWCETDKQETAKWHALAICRKRRETCNRSCFSGSTELFKFFVNTGNYIENVRPSNALAYSK